ncbi:MAG: hypothetical protein CML17_01970 [Pusillimonas sp.]|jgi:hypothetical protein|nr:hypothetical protein [Pusillimonas sp.]
MTPAAASENVAATTAKANIENCTGVIARGPGDFVGQLVGDTSNTTITMAAGAVYPIRVKSIDATSGIAVVLLYNV